MVLIIFDGAELDRTVCLDMSADSKCLLAETIVMGREAMGEDIRVCHFTDNWRLYREGQLFHAESLRLTDRVRRDYGSTREAVTGQDYCQQFSMSDLMRSRWQVCLALLLKPVHPNARCPVGMIGWLSG